MSGFKFSYLWLALIKKPLIIKGTNTAWKLSKIQSFSGPYFPVFGLNIGKYGPEKLHKVTIKNAKFFVLIVSCLRTHQRKILYWTITQIFRWWVHKHETISTKKFAFLIVTLWIKLWEFEHCLWRSFFALGPEKLRIWTIHAV